VYQPGFQALSSTFQIFQGILLNVAWAKGALGVEHGGHCTTLRPTSHHLFCFLVVTILTAASPQSATTHVLPAVQQRSGLSFSEGLELVR